MEQAHQPVIASICEELIARPEVSGIVLAQPSGGRYDKNSDLDFYVVIDAPWRQRRQFRRDGVPVELFLNPPARIERYLKEGESDTIYMLAFGRILFDRNGEVARLAARPRALGAGAGTALEAGGSAGPLPGRGRAGGRGGRAGA